MELTVNGEKHEHTGEGRLSELLRELGADAGRVAVMVNGEVVTAAERDGVRLRAGDEVEVLTFVGGG